MLKIVKTILNCLIQYWNACGLYLMVIPLINKYTLTVCRYIHNKYTVKLVFLALYKIILSNYTHRCGTRDETMGLSTAIPTYICGTHYTYRCTGTHTYIIIRYAGAAGIHVGKLKYHSCVITVCGLCCFVCTLQQQFLYKYRYIDISWYFEISMASPYSGIH